MVVFGHLFMMGINDPVTTEVWLPFVTEPMFGLGSPERNPFNNALTWLQVVMNVSVGPLGVSIFFLVSGYVILRAIDGEAPLKFLVKRAFRLFPLSLLVGGLAALSTWAICTHYGVASPHTLASVVVSGFAATPFFNTFPTLPVMWSLTVEIFFYCMMAATAACFGRLGMIHLVVMAAGCAVLSIVCGWGMHQTGIAPGLASALTAISMCGYHSVYLLAGSVLLRAEQAGYSRLGLASVAAVLAVFAAETAATVATGSLYLTGTTPQNSVFALLIFVVAQLLGLSRQFRPGLFCAAISYPLYLVHIPIGWIVLFIFSRLGTEQNIAATLACLICVFLAWLLHHAVEVPSQKAGKGVAQRLVEKRPAAT